MSKKPLIALRVSAERSGEEPFPWSWSVYNENPEMLIARSRAEFAERGQAIQAGNAVGKVVRRKLELMKAREIDVG